jgi:hypothetical protein
VLKQADRGERPIGPPGRSLPQCGDRTAAGRAGILPLEPPSGCRFAPDRIQGFLYKLQKYGIVETQSETARDQRLIPTGR